MRKANGIIQSESEGLRIRGVSGVGPSVDTPAQEKENTLSSLSLSLYIYIFVVVVVAGSSLPRSSFL